MSTPATVTVAEIMDAIAEQLETELAGVIDGIQIDARMNPNPTPPAIDIYPADPFLEQTTFGDWSGEAFFVVRAVVTTADNTAGQDELLALIDPRASTSVVAALASDSTLGGTVADSNVVEHAGFRTYRPVGLAAAGGDLLGSEWRLRTVLE